MPYAHTDHPVDPSNFTPGKRYYFESFTDELSERYGRGFWLRDNNGQSRHCVERGSSRIKSCGDWIITEDDETAKPSPHTVPLTIRVPLDRVSAVAEEFEVVGTG